MNVLNIRFGSVWIFTILAVLLCGCVREVFENEPQKGEESEYLSFRASFTPMTKTAAERDYTSGYLSVHEEDWPLVAGKEEGKTKATALMELDEQSASVSAILSKSVDTWSSYMNKKFTFDYEEMDPEDSPISWSAAGDADMTVFAFSPYPKDDDPSLTFSETPPAITYTSSVDNLSRHKDVIAAFKHVPNSSFGNEVVLEFGHVLTGVRLKVGFDCFLKSVSLTKVKTSGTYQLGNLTWSATDERVIKFDVNSDVKSGYFLGFRQEGDVIKDEGVLMMIPQTLSGSEIVLTYNEGGEDKTISASLDGVEWKPGKLITYTLNKAFKADKTVYFDLALGDVSISSTRYSGKVYVAGVSTDVTGDMESGKTYMYYIYQSDGTSGTNGKKTGWKSAIGDANGITIPQYNPVTHGGKSWADFITNNQVVETVIEAWDNKNGNAGAVRSVGRTATNFRINVSDDNAPLDCHITIDNIYSNYQDSNHASRTTGGITYKPKDKSNSSLTVNFVGDNRFGAIHYHDVKKSETVPESNNNQLIIQGTGTLTVADVNLADVVSMPGDSDKDNVIGGTGYYANHWCAAIGNNDSADDCRGIVINSGTIFAGTTAAENCTAIGGGGNGFGGVKINGGTVTAVATTTGTAIGGGIGFNSPGGVGYVEINGGNVYAYNHANRWNVPSSAIGGAGSKKSSGSKGTVIITGGNVYAQSALGTAIGGGSSYSVQGGEADVQILGGTVEAKSISAKGGNGGPDSDMGRDLPGGAGIGGGSACTGDQTAKRDGGDAIIVIGGNAVVRTGSIGGGLTYHPNGNIGSADISITGGDIQAQFIMASGASKSPKFNMSGGTIRNSDVTDPVYIHKRDLGGAVYIEDGAFTMTGGTIRDCSAVNGGAVYIMGSNNPTFTMSGGTIKDCKAVDSDPDVKNNGGAVYLENGTVKLNGTAEVRGCSADKGGAFYIKGNASPELKMTGGSIYNCVSDGDGGGVYLEGGIVDMSGGSIYSNIAKGGNGGGVSVMAGSFNMSGGDVSENTSVSVSSVGGNGGGIFVSADVGTVSVELTRGQITRNSADRLGGGVCVDMSAGTAAAAVQVGSPTGQVADPSIKQNRALLQGGGLYVSGINANVNFDSGTVDENIVTGYVYNENVANEGGMVTLNNAQADNGKVAVTHVNVTFKSNPPSSLGAALDGKEEVVQKIVTSTQSLLVEPSVKESPGYHFVGWHTRADGDNSKGQAYTDGQVMNITENLTLYAQWAHD